MDPKLINILPTSPKDVVYVEDRTGVWRRDWLAQIRMSSWDPFPPCRLWYQWYSEQNSLQLCPPGCGSQKRPQHVAAGPSQLPALSCVPVEAPFLNASRTIQWPPPLRRADTAQEEQELWSCVQSSVGPRRLGKGLPYKPRAASWPRTRRGTAYSTLLRGCSCSQPHTQFHAIMLGGRRQKEGSL